jgi:hypothetical protein
MNGAREWPVTLVNHRVRPGNAAPGNGGNCRFLLNQPKMVSTCPIRSEGNGQ